MVTESRISKELLYAILSMDAYNRGYGAAVAVPGAGSGLVRLKSNFVEVSDWENYGLHGALYDVTNGSEVEGLSGVNQVVSFSGTDDLKDILYVW